MTQLDENAKDTNALTKNDENAKEEEEGENGNRYYQKDH